MATRKPADKSIPGTAGVLAAMTLLLAVMASAAWRAEKPRRPAADATVDSADAEAAAWPVVRIDLNAATEAELTLLPGIGPTLAARIADDRARRGPFADLDDLRRVRGVGPVTVARAAGLATAGDAGPATNSTAAAPADDIQD